MPHAEFERRTIPITNSLETPSATIGVRSSAAKADTVEPGAPDHYAEAWAHSGSLTVMPNDDRALRERPTTGEPARLTSPALIVWAGNDMLLERNAAEAGLALCDDGTREIVEGKSHRRFIEQPKRINTRIIELVGGKW